METEQLIRTLAADNPHRARPVGFVLALALLATAPVSFVGFCDGARRSAGHHDSDA